MQLSHGWNTDGTPMRDAWVTEFPVQRDTPIGAWFLGLQTKCRPGSVCVSSVAMKSFRLNEYVLRFNRRRYPLTAFHSVLGLAARPVPPTYEKLYAGCTKQEQGEHADIPRQINNLGTAEPYSQTSAN